MTDSNIQSLLDHWAASAPLQYAFRWLYKDGLETGFYAELLRRAPSVTLAFTAHGHLRGYVEFAEAMKITDPAARHDRLRALEKVPGATWRGTLGQVRVEDRPLLEAWIDRCANLERGEAAPAAPTGKRVRHKTFGEGTMTALVNQTATVVFDSGEEKRLRISFLEVLQ